MNGEMMSDKKTIGEQILDHIKSGSHESMLIEFPTEAEAMRVMNIVQRWVFYNGQNPVMCALGVVTQGETEMPYILEIHTPTRTEADLYIARPVGGVH